MQALRLGCLIWSISCLYSLKSHGQPHILNPGFETYEQCPEDHLDAEQVRYWASTYPVRAPDSDDPWYFQHYHHICDRQVEVYWKPILGNGVLRIPYAFDTTTDEVLTALLWTKLGTPLEKDSLYYLAYTTAPTHFYYPPDQQFYQHWCVSPNLRLSFTKQATIDTLTDLARLSPLYLAEESGIRADASNTLTIGNCYQATGEEEYYLFGHYRHPRTAADERCLGSSINTRFGAATSLVDNFRLEEMKLDICCDQKVCQDDIVDFSSYTQAYVFPPGTSFKWNDGETALSRSFLLSGAYQLTIMMPCGSISSNWIQVEVDSDCSSAIYVPTAFSPNGDGLNDNFFPLLSKDFDIEIQRLSIFDRWGNQVYQYYGNPAGWDGTVNGKAAAVGVYTWLLEYRVLIGDEPIHRKEVGDLSLMR